MYKNISTRQKGSALLVTIMITSVVLLFAMILLERIIPYSKQIRGMQDSVQAYYTAKGEVEMARSMFRETRENIDPDNRIENEEENVSLIPPNFDSKKYGSYLIVSEHKYLPLHMRLFAGDENVRSFGKSQKNSNFHTFTDVGGGILFDMSNRATDNFSMILETDAENETIEGDISIEFVHSEDDKVEPFFGSSTTRKVIHKRDIAEITGNQLGKTLAETLSAYNCTSAGCSLKVLLRNTAISPTTLPVKFTISTPLPDLNAVIVADGISPNGAYHSRIIELIPLIQGI